MGYQCEICGKDPGDAWYQLKDGHKVCDLCLRKARLRSMLDLDYYDLEKLKKRIEEKEALAKEDPTKAVLLLPELVEPYLEMKEKQKQVLLRDRMRGGMFKSNPNKFLLDFDDINDFVLVDDGVEVAYGKRGGELSSTRVKSPDQKFCTTLDLVIHLAKEDQPECVIHFINKQCKRGSGNYKIGRGAANQVMRTLQLLFDYYPIEA